MATWICAEREAGGAFSAAPFTIHFGCKFQHHIIEKEHICCEYLHPKKFPNFGCVQNVRLVELLDEARDTCAATIRARREETGDPIDEVQTPLSPPSSSIVCCFTLVLVAVRYPKPRVA